MIWSMDQDNLRSADSISDNNPPHRYYLQNISTTSSHISYAPIVQPQLTYNMIFSNKSRQILEPKS